MKKSKNMNRGAAILSVIFVLLFFILFGRFFYIQATGTVDGQVLAVKAKEKYEKKRMLEARRGQILDQKGNVLAEDTVTYTLVAVLDEKMTTDPDHPNHVVDPEETAEKLAPILGMKQKEIETILKKDKFQVEFGEKGRNISFAKKQQIEKLKLPGIGFIRDTKRFYPNGKFASYVIGYAKRDEKTGKTTGQLGIEKSLDKYLQETDGYVIYESDRSGYKLPGSKDKIVTPNNGADVYLTIDQKIQTFLEDALNEAEKQYQPTKMIGIVADPKTGKILAMSQRPSFDPNERDIQNFYNDAVSYRFEPGSTMKIFTLAAAVNEGVYNGNEKYKSGMYKVKGASPIYDHNNVGWGTITFDEAVQRSSNVGFAILAHKKIGLDRFYQYLNRFGFLEKTGIDLPNEENSKLNYKWERDKISTAFGQASAFTPIQLVQAATAIANDGKMMKPYVIDKIVDPDTNQVLKKTEPSVEGEPITKETAAKTLELLETVVTSEHGTGKPFQIPGYHIAGKTGTAQIAGEGGRYLTGRENYVFSFLGMAPRENPELIVYVAVQQPKLKPTETGSAPVSMIFKSVMKNSLEYLKIEPTTAAAKEEKNVESEKEVGVSLLEYKGQQVQQAVQELEKQQIQPIVLGGGATVTSQYPSATSRVIQREKVFLLTDGAVKMPNISGWSLRDVMKLCSIMELELKYEGSGYVNAQNIKPGTEIRKGDQLTIKLKKPK